MVRVGNVPMWIIYDVSSSQYLVIPWFFLGVDSAKHP